jgi:hypothetical protein
LVEKFFKGAGNSGVDSTLERYDAVSDHTAMNGLWITAAALSYKTGLRRREQ